MNKTNNSFSMHIEEEDKIKEQNKLFPEINDNRSKLIKSEENNKENNNMILKEKHKKKIEKRKVQIKILTQNINHKYYHLQNFPNFNFFQEIL